MSDTIIKVENLSKQYRLGVVGTGTISHDLNRAWARLRGKEDPFAKVGDLNDRSKSKTSDYVWALKDINFDVKQGEVLGIVGKNGAGKSTLLKILSRITTPTTGSIKINGRVASLLEVGTGFHPDLTGRENIYLNGAILGMRKMEISKKLDEIVDFAGTEKFIDTPVKRYSSGMKVRLGFAVAAHLEPEILVVDEVLAVGDTDFQEKCLGKMNDISHNSGRTILFVSHNLSAVNSLCPKSVLIANGQVAMVGETGSVIEEYLRSPDQRSMVEFSTENTKTKKAEILNVRFTNHTSNTFEVNEDINLETHIVFNETCNYSFAAIMVYDRKGNMIFLSSNEDVQESSIHKTKTGLVKLQTTIPHGLLKPGTYFIHLSVFEKVSGNLDKVAPALTFEVVDHQTRRGMLNLYRQFPIIAPVLNWSEEDRPLDSRFN